MLRTIEFCCGGKKCPTVTELPNGNVALGGEKEGSTYWDKAQFTDFVNAAKSGKFDELTEK